MSRIDSLEETLRTALAEIELLRIEHQNPCTKPKVTTKRQDRIEKYKLKLARR
ncbi:MAG: hypothetical protein K0B15_07265 [Lentimicrobium sp.]|nr:hypothetical protein [Lentimicrobium sp.]